MRRNYGERKLERTLLIAVAVLNTMLVSQTVKNAPRYAVLYDNTEAVVVTYNRVETNENGITLTYKDNEVTVPAGYNVIINNEFKKDNAYQTATQFADEENVFFYSDFQNTKYAICYNEEEAIIVEYDHIVEENNQTLIYTSETKYYTLPEGYRMETYENTPKVKVERIAATLVNNNNVLFYDDIAVKNYVICYNNKRAVIIEYNHIETKGSLTLIHVNEKEFIRVPSSYGIMICNQMNKKEAYEKASTVIAEEKVSFYNEVFVRDLRLRK